MATKSRTTLVPESAAKTQIKTLVPTPVLHPIWGWRDCLPYKVGQTFAPNTIVLPPTLYEVITDESPALRSKDLVIRNCAHTKFTCSPGSPVERLGFNQNYVCRESVNVDTLVYYPTLTKYDLSPSAEMLFGGLARSMIQGLPGNCAPTVSFQNAIPKPDRGRLAAMVLAKAQELSLGQTLIEAREVPKLAEVFKLRRELTKNIEQRDWLRKELSNATKAGIPALAAQLKACSNRIRREKLWTALRKQASGTYLGLIFGVLPTISDAQAIAQKCAKGFKARRTSYTAMLRTDTTASNNPAHWDGADVRGIVLQERLKGTRVEGVVLTDNRPRYHSEKFQQWADRMDAGFGLNPAGAIYQVLPFSWAVDWVSSLDDVIDALFLANTSSFSAQYWSSIKCVCNGTISADALVAISGIYPDPVKETKKRIDGVSYNATYYSRSRAEAPSALESFRYRFDPIMGLTGIMVALGFG